MVEPARMPHARVKRIMKEDPEVMAVSNAAVHTMSAAVQLFVGQFAEQALLNARAAGRSRIAYQDFANAVAQQEQLDFLSSIVPKTVPMAEVRKRREEAGLDTESQSKIPFPRREEQLEDSTDSE